MVETKQSLVGKVVTVGVLAVVGIGSYGCGNMQTRSQIPKLPSRDHTLYGLMKGQQDTEMGEARFLRGEGYGIDKLARPYNG